MLEFEVLCDRNHFIDLQNFLEFKCKISRSNDGVLRTGADSANTDGPYLSNNALHSLFSVCTLSAANVAKFSNEIGNYAHKAFIETEFLSLETAKNKWLVCQGYSWVDEPAKIDVTDGLAGYVAARKTLVANSQENSFIGKPAIDILTCDKHLLSGVALWLLFRRFSKNFVVIFEYSKHYKL